MNVYYFGVNHSRGSRTTSSTRNTNTTFATLMEMSEAMLIAVAEGTPRTLAKESSRKAHRALAKHMDVPTDISPLTTLPRSFNLLVSTIRISCVAFAKTWKNKDTTLPATECLSGHTKLTSRESRKTAHGVKPTSIRLSTLTLTSSGATC